LRESQQQLFDTDTSLFAVNERLRAVNKELEAFSYSVSHDLRAPLRSIDGFALALMEDCADQLDATGQNYLQRVRAATLRMGQLIDDLLHLSRLSQAELRRGTVELSALAESITTELRHREPERQVEWVIAAGVAAEGDARLLRVALENLLGNAWKYTGTRPRGQIEFGVTKNWGRPVYFVRDNGVGFDMAYADKLFGAFQRLHGASEFPGTGIGLATVQRIVHRHGGQIWAEAAVDQGATFCFTLAHGTRDGE
jgi:light-regulated signal transduction histidine kinase (bacteriophytochrome)